MENLSVELLVKLMGSNPHIWRKIIIPYDITLDRLSDVLAIGFNWDNYFDYNFEIDEVTYFDFEDEDKDESFTERDSKLHRLNKLVEEGDLFIYNHDFDNTWSLEIEVGSYLEYDEDRIPVYCENGELSPPPEKLSNLEEYYKILKELEEVSPSTTKEDALEAFNEEYSRPDFDIKYLNYFYYKFCLWSRDRILQWEPFDEDQDELFEEIKELVHQKFIEQYDEDVEDND